MFIGSKKIVLYFHLFYRLMPVYCKEPYITYLNDVYIDILNDYTLYYLMTINIIYFLNKHSNQLMDSCGHYSPERVKTKYVYIYITNDMEYF